MFLPSTLRGKKSTVYRVIVIIYYIENFIKVDPTSCIKENRQSKVSY